MSNLNNVSLWFARSDEGEIITIDKIQDGYEGKYHCPLCGSEVIPKAMDSDCVSPHFAHIDRSKCSGESMVHWWVKNELIKVNDVFEVETDVVKQYMCKNIDFEKSFDTPNGRYKPDIVVETYCGETIFIEVNFTNSKKLDDYWAKWIYLNKTVIEFNVKNMYCEDENNIKVNNCYKSIFYKEKDININSNDYILYKKKIHNKIPKSLTKSLHEIEWFIDDIYKYNVNCLNIEDMTDRFGSIVAEDKYKDILIHIYKNKKCNKALSDIILHLEDIFYNSIKNKISKNVKKRSIGTNRLIANRIFGKETIYVYEYESYSDGIDKDEVFKYMTKYEYEKIKTSGADSSIYREGVVFSIEHIFNEGGIYRYLDKCYESINKQTESIIQNTKVVKKNCDEIKLILTKSYTSESILYNYIYNKCRFDDEYNCFQNKFLYCKDVLSVGELIEKKLNNFNYFEINGVKFYNLSCKEVDNIIQEIKEKTNIHTEKYYNTFSVCNELKNKFDEFKYRKEFIRFNYNGESFRTDLKKLYHKEYNLIASIHYENIFEQIVQLVEDVTYYEQSYKEKACEIVDKLKDRYSNNYRKYEVLCNWEGILLYKINSRLRRYSWGFGRHLICTCKYKEGGLDEEHVIKQFSDAIRNYLYGGSN